MAELLGLSDEAEARGAAGVVYRLADRRRHAGHEGRVAAIGGGDRMAAGAERAGGEGGLRAAVSAPVPRVVAPSLKVTVPVGVPGTLEVTLAVKVTGWPNTLLSDDEVTVVVVALPAISACASPPKLGVPMPVTGL